SGESLDAIFFSAMDFESKTGHRLASSVYFDWKCPGRYPSGKEALLTSLRSNSFPVCAFMYVFRRQVVESPTPLRFLSILHEDEVFTPMLMMNCDDTVIVNEKFYRRRVRSNSIMTSPVGIKNVIGY